MKDFIFNLSYKLQKLELAKTSTKTSEINQINYLFTDDVKQIKIETNSYDEILNQEINIDTNQKEILQSRSKKINKIY